MLYNDPFFKDVQLQKIFPDGKTFVDCTPKYLFEEIAANYTRVKDEPDFILANFVLENFELPVPHSSHYQSDISKGVVNNIESLWQILTRQASVAESNSTLLPLPYPYIVPGGRFGEIYYWDSYFTMLGLVASGKIEMVENMVNNFSFLIDTYGHIPNGNRDYFISRSQPPFYSLMVKLLAEAKGNTILINYLPQLEKEYQFWMKGKDELAAVNNTAYRVVNMPDGEILNRYWDQCDTPRPESYREDVELSHQSNQNPAVLFRHLRAGAESGWDYSCRWFKDRTDFSTIHTTEIIPVDLNCLLYHLEQTIAEACEQSNEKTKQEQFLQLATERKKAIQKYCWNSETGFFFDYDFVEKKQKKMVSLAGIAPLFFNMAEKEQAEKVKQIVETTLVKDGGVVSSNYTTGQQWDAPNGWAPLQWMTILGFENYGYTELAATIAKRWIKLNTAVFNRIGKLMEKYNVVDTHLEAGGGEYEGQDGFGWTNGVLLALIAKYGKAEEATVPLIK
jgi:alpha,alpha-trehalase